MVIADGSSFRFFLAPLAAGIATAIVGAFLGPRGILLAIAWCAWALVYFVQLCSNTAENHGVARPARSTANAILDRHERLRKNRRHRKWKPPGAAPLETRRPNQVWPENFKGQFKTRDAKYCYPLTVTDHYSRTLLVCRVSAAGTFRLKAKQPFLSNALTDEHIGLEEVGDGLWNIVYYRTLLGRIDERNGRITGVEV